MNGGRSKKGLTTVCLIEGVSLKVRVIAANAVERREP